MEVTTMAYTNEQKERMVAKLMSMPSGTEFKLNKNDSCPLDVRIEKTLAGGKTYLYLVDVETGNNMIVCGFLYGQHGRNECYAKLVDEIEDLIENWDLVLKQHFIDLGNKMGYEM